VKPEGAASMKFGLKEWVVTGLRPARCRECYTVSEARCCSVNEVRLREVQWKSLAITWHRVDHMQSLVPWPDSGGMVSDRRGILNSRVSELKVSEDGVSKHHSYRYSLHMGVNICNCTHNHRTRSYKTVGKPIPMQISKNWGAQAYKGTFLITLACGLFQELAPHDRKNLPKVKQSDDFPYRSSGTLLVFILSILNDLLF
jgi:hypothetical protein